MTIFTQDRMGQPLTQGERSELEWDVIHLESCLKSEAWINHQVEQCADLMGSWDRDLVLLCGEHDLHFMKLTLETGIIQMGEELE